MALDGEGFFVAEGADGRLRLTRDGHFLVDAEGFLTTAQGERCSPPRASRWRWDALR